jgi:hypothetical protein
MNNRYDFGRTREPGFLVSFFSTLFVLVATAGLFAGAVLVGAALFAFPIEWLWNYTVPHLFHGVPTLDFWHALGLGMLCGLLFRPNTPSSPKKSE